MDYFQKHLRPYPPKSENVLVDFQLAFKLHLQSSRFSLPLLFLLFYMIFRNNYEFCEEKIRNSFYKKGDGIQFRLLLISINDYLFNRSSNSFVFSS